jgi:hypothetical protein
MEPARLLSRSIRARRSWRLIAVIGVACAAASSRATASETIEASPYEGPTTAAPRNWIDEATFPRWRELGLEPARPCSDAVFVRRIYIDLIGTVPTAAEANAFLGDRAAAKRARLVDQLLARDEFADYWTMKWSDVLRIKAEFPINLWPNAAQAYHRWVYVALRDNLPYDQFVRGLLTSSGSNFRVGAVNFYRALQSREPEAIARTVALAFLGVRVDSRNAAQFAGLAACFGGLTYKPTGEWKEEIVFFASDRTVGAPTTATMPDGTLLALTPGRDPREHLAAWLTAPENSAFARAGANRIWAWLFGRGIVHEPDDFRPDNPPSQPQLLVALGEQFARGAFDLRRLIRDIVNSQTYQLSSVARGPAMAAEASFACYPLRRLDAEVLIDALNQITGTTEKYSSAIPEPFTFLPDDQHAVALPDGSITSSFLELFGRPGRDTGLFAERVNRVTAAQRLHLLNSTHVQRKLEQGPAMQALLRRTNPRETVDLVFFTLLSRPPTVEERALALARVGRPGADGRDALRDLVWALVNTAEFLHQH